jgi:hypothetical protein
VADRVPLDLVMLALRQEYERTGDERYNVSDSAVRNWKYRNLISKGRGYDLGEITAYLDRRGDHRSDHLRESA